VKKPQDSLIKESERTGKASAVNIFLNSAKADICILISATQLSPLTVSRVSVYHFLVKSQCWMTGGHLFDYESKHFNGIVAPSLGAWPIKFR